MPKTKLIFFDLDGTLIDGYEYIYSHLWDYFGIDRIQPRAVLHRYLRQEISYDDWVANDVRLLQTAGATKAKILEAIATLTPMAGARTVLPQLKARGHKLFILSGSIDLVLEAMYPDYQSLFDNVFINRYVFNEDGLIQHAIPTKYDMERKAACIIDTAAGYGMTLADCIFIGDNVNDVNAALVAGTSIAFNAKSHELVQVATHHVDSNDLRDLLPLIP